MPSLTFFSGDEDNAIACTRPIERCRGCIFKHLHALDARGVEPSEGINATHVLGVVGHGHAVYHIEWCSVVHALLVERTKSAYGYFRTATTWRTRKVGYVYTCNTALQQVFKTRRGYFLQIFGLYRANGSHLFACVALTVGNNGHFAQHFFRRRQQHA